MNATTIEKLKTCLNEIERNCIAALDTSLDAKDREIAAPQALHDMNKALEKARPSLDQAHALIARLLRDGDGDGDDASEVMSVADRRSRLNRLDRDRLVRKGGAAPKLRVVGGAHLVAEYREAEQKRLRATW